MRMTRGRRFFQAARAERPSVLHAQRIDQVEGAEHPRQEDGHQAEGDIERHQQGFQAVPGIPPADQVEFINEEVSAV